MIEAMIPNIIKLCRAEEFVYLCSKVVKFNKLSNKLSMIKDKVHIESKRGIIPINQLRQNHLPIL